MTGRAVLAVLALIVLAGCAGLGADTADISVEVTETSEAVVGGPFEVPVTLENDGDDGNETVTLAVDGSAVDNQTVTVEPDNQTETTLEHTFDEPGDHEVTVANQSWTVTVGEDPTPDVLAEHEATAAYETTESIEADLVSNGDPFTIDAEGTGVYDLEAETAYTEFDVEMAVFGMEIETLEEEWYEDGLVYERETEGEIVEYDVEPGSFDDVALWESDLLPSLTPSVEEDVYRYTLEMGSMQDFPGDDPGDFGLMGVDSATITYDIDRETLAYERFTMAIEGNEMNFGGWLASGTIEFDIHFDAVEGPVDASVPETVREEAESSDWQTG